MRMRNPWCTIVSRAVLFVVLVAVLAQSALAAKNVILMISDGAGFNTFAAAGMYQGKLGKQVYDGEKWVKLACSTYPLSLSSYPTGSDKQTAALVYDPAKAWDKSVPESEDPAAKTFAGYAYLTGTPTDSAAAATALATGVKTYNSAINWTCPCAPLHDRTIAELAKAAGKSVGVITSVPLSHATPAGIGGAHNCTRNDYVGIANEMLNAPHLDVIMGAGHPEFNDNGKPRKTGRDYQYVGGAGTWKRLAAGTHPAGWQLVQTKAEFELLAADPSPPAKVLGVAQAATTLQQKRSKGLPSLPGVPPQSYNRPLNRNVPALETMTAAAINCLEQNPNGFFLMIEGGAVDWASHANEEDRVIEEQVDFVKAVERAVAWIEEHGGWRDTLLIITSDHECGMLWGPNSDKAPFDPIVDRGAGRTPGMRFNAGGHTNSLVPLYACGRGSEAFYRRIVSTDPAAAATWGITGQYIDNTGVFAVMKEAVAAKPRAVRRKAG